MEDKKTGESASFFSRSLELCKKYAEGKNVNENEVVSDRLLK